jgi:hypothetical protein
VADAPKPLTEEELGRLERWVRGVADRDPNTTVEWGADDLQRLVAEVRRQRAGPPALNRNFEAAGTILLGKASRDTDLAHIIDFFATDDSESSRKVIAAITELQQRREATKARP